MKNIVFLILLGSLLTSCSKKVLPAETTTPQLVDFTDALVKKYGWSPADLARIQFYISEDITLTKKTIDNYAKIEDGVVYNGGTNENSDIKLPKGTPGVFIRLTSQGFYAISFDTINPQEILKFKANSSQNNRCTLSIKEDSDKNRYFIDYLGSEWDVTSSSFYAGLQIDLRQALKETREVSTMSGRKVTD